MEKITWLELKEKVDTYLEDHALPKNPYVDFIDINNLGRVEFIGTLIVWADEGGLRISDKG